jgi:formate C-acetyltransferase
LFRRPLIPGVNDGGEETERTAEFIRSLGRDIALELMPYHRMGATKYEALRMDYAMGELPALSPAEAEKTAEAYRQLGIDCRYQNKESAVMAVDRKLLNEIDGLELSASNMKWREAMKAAEWSLCADRDKLAVKSWRETVGEDIQIRRAKLFREIVENLPISILEFDQLAGRPTKKVIGCCAAIDVAGDYIPDLWDDTEVLGVTMDASARVDRDTIEALRESVRTFSGPTAPEMTYKAWEAAMGDWPRQAEAAKLKDPSLDSAIFGQCTSTVNFKKILAVGLRGIINEAKAHIDEWHATSCTDIDRLYFWQSAVIVLEAAICLAHRYSELAAQMAEEESDAVRAAELREIAATCARVPEHPAAGFHEALQSMAIIGVCKCLEHPPHANPHWGRGDQYLYPYFMDDIQSGKITLKRAAQLLADLIGRWGTQTMVESASQKESHQINFCINNMMLGGLDVQGEDTSNELSYLMLHMVGLLKLSSPTVCLRWNRKTRTGSWKRPSAQIWRPGEVSPCLRMMKSSSPATSGRDPA